MKNKLTLIISIIAIFLILTGSIAYYRIVVNGKIKLSTGNAVFILKDENSNEWNNKKITLGQISPGDSGSFTVTMDASTSEMDMYATLELDKGSLPTNLKFYTTSDHKSELYKYYSFLEKDGTNKETLTIYWYWDPYIDNIEDNKFINMESMEANVKVSSVQISEYAMMKNGFYNKTEFWSDTYRPYIRKIVFKNNLSNLSSECTEENLCWDISYDSNQNKKVYGYLIDTGLTVDETDTSTNTITTKPLYNLYIVSDVMIFAPINCNYLFQSFGNLIQINFNNNFNTSKVTNMWCMFAYSSSLATLNLDSFNTSNVINMGGMFMACSSLINIDLSNFNTSSVTDMNSMFNACKSLLSLNISGFNTSNITNMAAMFNSCFSLTNLDLSNFNTSNVTQMAGMFCSCRSLMSIDLSNFDTSKVETMYAMFIECFLLESLDLSNFNTSKVTDMHSMFNKCYSLISLDISNFNTSSVINMNGMFNRCYKLQTEIIIMNPNVTNYTDMFLDSATDSNAKIIVNYTSKTESLVDNMILAKPSNSNVVKGIQI